MLWPTLVLPTPGGPTRQRIEPEMSPLHLADGDEFEDALLDVLQPVVIAIENLACPRQVVGILGILPPGQDGEPIEVAAGDVVLGRSRLKEAQLLHLVVHGALRLGVEFQTLEAGLELLDLAGLPFLCQPQFLLDRLELFAEKKLPLLRRDLLLDRFGDLGLQARDLQLLL